MTPIIQFFASNEFGRDFVIGDLHGCIDEFEALLDRISFQEEVDRMFSVGDLIDRGPDSMACLRLLREPWFHATKGNHEDMMIECVRTRDPRDARNWLHNGGDWGFDEAEMGNPEFFDLVNLASKLPLTIIVETRQLGRFGICHAEPPSAWTEDAISKTKEAVIWGRTKINAWRTLAKAPGIDFSVHGHTITDSLKVRDDLNAFWIDLGCYLTGRLCALQIAGDGINWPEKYIVE